MIPYRNVDGGVRFIEIFLDHIYDFILLGLQFSKISFSNVFPKKYLHDVFFVYHSIIPNKHQT